MRPKYATQCMKWSCLYCVGHWAMEKLFLGPTPHNHPNKSCAVATLPNQTSLDSRVWHWLAILEGYNLEIRHIPRKENPTDSLSRQLVANALVRKGSVKDSNAEYVQKLSVNERATDRKIQDGLHKLFKSNLQGIQEPQGRSILTETSHKAIFNQAQDPQ